MEINAVSKYRKLCCIRRLFTSRSKLFGQREAELVGNASRHMFAKLL